MGSVYHLSAAFLFSSRVRLNCGSVRGQRDAPEENKYCEVSGPGEQLPEARPRIALKIGDLKSYRCQGNRRLQGVGQILSVDWVYAVLTLNPTLCHIASQ